METNLAAAALLELRLAADPKAVPGARSQAGEVCAAAGISEDDCFALDLALGEALANAVLHGAPKEKQPHRSIPSVSLEMWRYDGCLIIQVCDSGPGFSPPEPPYPMPPAASGATHGRGLPLMETLTDAMLACRRGVDESGTCIYLVKNLSKSA